MRPRKARKIKHIVLDLLDERWALVPEDVVRPVIMFASKHAPGAVFETGKAPAPGYVLVKLLKKKGEG